MRELLQARCFCTSSCGQFGCNTSAAMGPARQRLLRCGGACPSDPSSAAVFPSVVSDTWLSGRSCGLVLLLLPLCVEFGRVDVPIQPVSVYSRVVPVLKSQSNRASFLFLFFFYFA
jgi:hypothetical protein